EEVTHQPARHFGMNTKLLLSSSALLVALASVGCAQTPVAATPAASSDHLVQSVLWVQRSGEYRALCYQAFNAARAMLDQELKKDAPAKKRAIIADLDETILNNSAYEARLIKTRQGWSKQSWQQWADLARAETTAGSVEFLNYAATNGVE